MSPQQKRMNPAEKLVATGNAAVTSWLKAG